MNPTYNMPENYYFGGGSQESFLTPWAIVILGLAAVLIFLAPRKRMLLPFVVPSLILPYSAVVVVQAGAAHLHLSPLRLLVIVALLRILVRRDLPIPRLTAVDKAVLAWAFCNAVFFIALWGTMGAVTNRLGYLLTNVGPYFLLRALIRDKSDVIRFIRMAGILFIFLAPLMLYEHFTQHNPFAIMGVDNLSMTREGSVRATGPFEHSIIAGTVAGMMIPLYLGLWWQGKRHRLLVVLSIAASLCMISSSASITPFMTAVAGVFAICLWSWRGSLRMFRWGLVLMLVALQMLMTAPIWFLIARAGGKFGGSGYHRAMLIDNFVHHFWDWWLVGTQNNASWGYDMWDVDNAFVAAGLGGGLITLCAFVAVLVYAFKSIGESRRLAGLSPRDQRLVWAIGACLFANTVGFFGILYFDQSVLLWYAVLAMVSTTASFALPAKAVAQRRRRVVAPAMGQIVPHIVGYPSQTSIPRG